MSAREPHHFEHCFSALLQRAEVSFAAREAPHTLAENAVVQSIAAGLKSYGFTVASRPTPIMRQTLRSHRQCPTRSHTRARANALPSNSSPSLSRESFSRTHTHTQNSCNNSCALPIQFGASRALAPDGCEWQNINSRESGLQQVLTRCLCNSNESVVWKHSRLATRQEEL